MKQLVGGKSINNNAQPDIDKNNTNEQKPKEQQEKKKKGIKLTSGCKAR